MAQKNYSWTYTGGAGGIKGDNAEEGSQGSLNILGVKADKRINNSQYEAQNTHYITEADIPDDIRKLYEITLSFNNNGGSAEISPVTVGKGESVQNLSSFTAPTKGDDYFEGYFTAAEGGDKIFDHNGNYVAGDRTFTEDKTFYAHWIDTKFDVVWDYSYLDENGIIQLNTSDKSEYAKVTFNLGESNHRTFVVKAGTETDGTESFDKHRIARKTINVVVGSYPDEESTIYVSEEQLKNIQFSAIALASENQSDVATKYLSANNSNHEVVLSTIPKGTFMQPWAIVR